MLAPTFITIGRLLLFGLSSLQPTVAIPTTISTPIVQHASPIVVKGSQTAVSSYSTMVGAPAIIVLPAPAAIETVELSSEELLLIKVTNRDREQQGFPDLEINPLLCAIARNHSQDMANRGYFDHFAPAPGPKSPMDRYLAALGSRPDYAFVGENIYFRSATDNYGSSSAGEANSAFMRSPGHRANILQPKFTQIGIGFYRDPSTGAFWVTEMFLRDQE